MLRNLIILSAGLLSFASSQAEARPHGPKGPPLVKLLSKDVSLTDAQQKQLASIKEAKKSMRQQLRQEKAAFRQQWMADFVAGKIDSKQVLQNIDQKMSVQQKNKINMTKQMFQLLDSYSEEQKQQVLTNMKRLQKRFERKKQRFAETEEKGQSIRDRASKRNMKKAHKGRIFRAYLRGIELDEKQKELLSELKENMQNQAEEQHAKRQEKPGKWFQSILEERVSSKDAVRKIKTEGREMREFKTDMTKIWIELLESLSTDQKQQFLTNASTIQKRIQERKERKMERRKSRDHE